MFSEETKKKVVACAMAPRRSQAGTLHCYLGRQHLLGNQEPILHSGERGAWEWPGC